MGRWIKRFAKFVKKYLVMLVTVLKKYLVMLFVFIKKYLVMLVGPLIKGGKGVAYYISLYVSKIRTAITLVFSKMSDIVNQVAYFIYNAVKAVLVSIWRGTVFAFEKVIVKTFLVISHAYFWLFRFLLKSLKRFGIVGELIFTIYGLVWLLWPLYVAYKMEYRNEVWIGAVIITLILIVRGRKVIVEAGKQGN